MLKVPNTVLRNEVSKQLLYASSLFNYSTNNKSLANCWSCKQNLNATETKSFFCPCELKLILPVNKSNSYFQLFDLGLTYNISKKDLKKRFRDLMRQLHPDLFTLKSNEEKEYSSSQSSHLNKAYSTLLNPIERGLYMLELKGVNYESEAQAEDKVDEIGEKQKILMDIMELNEFIDEIREQSQVVELEMKLEEDIEPFERQLEVAFNNQELDKAVKLVAKMKYYENISERLAELKLKFNLESF